jgi:hypothetical protein
MGSHRQVDRDIYPFERALRDVNAAAGQVVFQRAMMEDCGRVALGLPSLLPMF